MFVLLGLSIALTESQILEGQRMGRISIDGLSESCDPTDWCFEVRIRVDDEITNPQSPFYEPTFSVAFDFYQGYNDEKGNFDYRNAEALTCFNSYFDDTSGKWKTFDGIPCEMPFKTFWIDTTKLSNGYGEYELIVPRLLTEGRDSSRIFIVGALWRRGCIGANNFFDGKNADILSKPAFGIGLRWDEKGEAKDLGVVGGITNGEGMLTVEKYLSDALFLATLGKTDDWRTACPKTEVAQYRPTSGFHRLTDLSPAFRITTDGSKKWGQIDSSGAEQWYRLEVETTGRYIIRTHPGTLTDTVIYLYGPNSRSKLIEKNDNVGRDEHSTLIEELSQGSYYVKVTGFVTKTGTYQVSVLRLDETDDLQSDTICSGISCERCIDNPLMMSCGWCQDINLCRQYVYGVSGPIDGSCEPENFLISSSQC